MSGTLCGIVGMIWSFLGFAEERTAAGMGDLGVMIIARLKGEEVYRFLCECRWMTLYQRPL